MYDIEKFVRKNIGVVFDSDDEMKIFSAECEQYGLLCTDAMSNIHRIYVTSWEGCKDNVIKHTSVNDESAREFLFNQGWSVINCNELLQIKLPSKVDLIDFLGE